MKNYKARLELLLDNWDSIKKLVNIEIKENFYIQYTNRFNWIPNYDRIFDSAIMVNKGEYRSTMLECSSLDSVPTWYRFWNIHLGERFNIGVHSDKNIMTNRYGHVFLVETNVLNSYTIYFTDDENVDFYRETCNGIEGFKKVLINNKNSSTIHSMKLGDFLEQRYGIDKNIKYTRMFIWIDSKECNKLRANDNSNFKICKDTIKSVISKLSNYDIKNLSIDIIDDIRNEVPDLPSHIVTKPVRSYKITAICGRFNTTYKLYFSDDKLVYMKELV